MKKIITICFSLLLLSTSAYSATFSIGASGNIAAYAASGTESEFDAGAIVSSNRETGAFTTEYGSVFGEIGINEIFSVGVDYVPMTFETPVNKSNEDQTNENRVHAEFEDLTTIYAKINIPLGGTYLKVGYSQVDVLTKEAMSSGSTYGNDTTQGPTLGLGYNHDVSNGFSIRAEVSASSFDDVSANSGAGANRTQYDITDMIGARGTISLVKTF
ncbi:outer membrane beta-barrel protein [Candidatus Pelagibacter communis]|uniref:outer membrane beta-barrel protein n=1 Tax=Candidatus Pelagibacter TaxID=198251 RepID=UPI003EDF3D9E